MNVRVLVPLKWDSSFREGLLLTLKDLGYRWQKGTSLTADQKAFHKMAYIAIWCNEPIVSFSSNKKMIDRPSTDLGLNYIMINPTIPNVVSAINCIKKYLAEDLSEESLRDFIESHYELKNLRTLS